MRKQDIIRIINEEIEFALEEQEKQLYKVVDDKGKVIQPDKSSDVDGLIKRIATKLAAKNPKWSIEKINEMYDPIYDSMIPEILGMIALGSAGVIKAFKYLKSKGLNDQTIISILNKAKEKVKGNVNENEGKKNDRFILTSDQLDILLDKVSNKIMGILNKEGRSAKAMNVSNSVKDTIRTYVSKVSKYYVNENEGMTKSLKDIDPNLSLTKFNTTPPSFKITYMKKEDMSNEMEEEIVAWILSKGGKIKSVSTQFDWDDDRYDYPTVYFKF
jgi:hypothetical protein